MEYDNKWKKDCLDDNGRIKIISGIYCIYNSKYFYVGQAIDINRRWNIHKRELINNLHKNNIIQSVYNKYNVQDPFKYKIIKIVDTNLNYWESEGIRKISEKYPNLICMNICDPKKCYSNNPEVKKKIKIALSGKSLSEMTKNKMSNSRKGKEHPWKWVKVVQLNTKGELIKVWNSKTHAEKELGFSIRIDDDRHGGYLWQNYEEWLVNPKKEKTFKHVVDTTIKQFSFNGTFIKEWNSIKEAGDILGISKTQICECLNNKGNMAGDFLWSYSYKCPKYIPQHNKKKIVEKYTLDNIFVEEYQSLAQAANSINSNPTTLRKRIFDKKEIGGFIWKFRV